LDLSTNDARIALAKKYGAKYNLAFFYVAAVCEQESSWNPWAARFEPEFYQRYISGMNLPDATERQMRATSFGLMQIMGQVAREHGFNGKFLTELCDPDIGVDIACRKLSACFTSYGDKPEVALLSYNGGGNPEYGKQVLDRVPKYQEVA
jgi:soluble lytic murein transglycosylase-like protein